MSFMLNKKNDCHWRKEKQAGIILSFSKKNLEIKTENEPTAWVSIMKIDPSEQAGDLVYVFTKTATGPEMENSVSFC